MDVKVSVGVFGHWQIHIDGKLLCSVRDESMANRIAWRCRGVENASVNENELAKKLGPGPAIF